MKHTTRRLAALLLVFVMMASTSLSAWAAPDTQAPQTDSTTAPDSGVSTATIDAGSESELKSEIQKTIFDERETMTTIDVSDCEKSEEALTAVTEEVLDEHNASDLISVTYETDETDNVSTMTVERDEALLMAMDELDTINNASEEPKSDEEMQKVYAHYADLQVYYEGNPDYWGVPVNYFTDKDTDASPVGAILSMLDKPADEVDINELDQTIVGIRQGLEAYIQYFGADLLAARDKALKSIDNNMSDLEKLLALHEYVATHANFDLSSILDLVEGTGGGTDLIKSTTFGALTGDNSAVCLGYAATYGYLVQCAFPEIYKNEAGEWKTKDELTDTYMVDYAMIKYNHTTDFGGSEIHFNAPHYFNAVKLNDQWYYIDPCYDDVNQEVLDQKRVETDGDCSHMFFLFSHEEMKNWYDGNYSVIDTAYADLCTDSSNDKHWSQSIGSPISHDETNWYYVDTQMNNREIANQMKDFNGDDTDEGASTQAEDGDYGDISGYDQDELLVIRNRASGETTTLFNYTTGEVTALDGTTSVNETLKADCDKDAAYQEIYPLLRHGTSLYNNKLYFNLANKVYVLDLETREITQVKEYNKVYAASNGARFVGRSYYSVPENTDETIEFSIEDHPVGGVMVRDDGKIYVSIATNLSYTTDPSYAYEETNFNSSYYAYGENTDEDENDNKEFSWCANVTDTMDMSHIEGSGHSYGKVTVAPTCTEGGFTEDRCTDCGKSSGTEKTPSGEEALGHHYIYDNAEGVYLCDRCYTASETAPDGVTEQHKYSTPTFAWNDDNTCTATFACDHDDDTEVKKCIVTTAVDGTCDKDHTITYTAIAFDVTGQKYTDEKTVIADAGAHDYDEPLFTWGQNEAGELICTADFICTVCQDKKTNECDVTMDIEQNPTCAADGVAIATATTEMNGETYTSKQQVPVPATGHTYGDPAFTWTEDKSACTATFTCSVCDDTQTVNCTVTSERVEPTYEADGSITYTASVTFGGQDYSDQKVDVLPMKSHAYGAPTFEWADDNTCNAVFTCTEDGCTDTQTVVCDVTHETTKSATCSETGTETYTATVTFAEQTYTDTKTEEIPVIAHTYGDPAFTWTEDKSACTATFTCSVCGDTQNVNCVITTNEDGSLTAACTFDEKEYTNTVDAPKTTVDQIFTDVNSDDWFYEKVQYVYDNQLMVGTSETTFSPNLAMTRAMVVQILYNNEKTNGTLDTSKPGTTFSDVSEDEWYYNAVQWASANGVCMGYEDGTFGPQDEVTREQFAQFLYNYEGKPHVDGSLDHFSDADQVSDWAVDAMTWANEKEIINGTRQSDDSVILNAKGNATRAEAASMLMSYFG